MKFIGLVFLSLLFSCNDQEISIQSSKSSNSTKLRRVIITKLPNGYWGYDILEKEKAIIHQTTIPGFQGSSGLPDSLTAGRIGTLVLQKIEKGIFPPTLSKKEVIDLWPMNAVLPED